jgi:hypothetical protein
MKKTKREFHWTTWDILSYTPFMIHMADVVYHLLVRVVLGFVGCILLLYSMSSVYGHYSSQTRYWSKRISNARGQLHQCKGEQTNEFLDCESIVQLSQSIPRVKAIESTCEWVASSITAWLPTRWCEHGSACRFHVQSLTNNTIQWAGFVAFLVIVLCILYVLWGICDTKHAILRTQNTYNRIPYIKPKHMRHKFIDLEDDYDEERALSRQKRLSIE